jgi:hypothetical protein
MFETGRYDARGHNKRDLLGLAGDLFGIATTGEIQRGSM